MAKQLQLTIPTPCHENWDNMTTVDKGKFCDSCQKQVVDFSNMSDRQVAEFFKKPSTGSVCGRFMNDQLDRTIKISRKRMSWVKYFFQFAIPAFLLSIKSTSAKAQGTVTVKKTSKPIKHIVGEPALAVCLTPLVADTIVMEEVVVIAKTIQTDSKKLYNTGVVTVSNQISNKLAGKVAGPVITVVNEIADITANRDLSKPTLTPVSYLQGSVGGVVVVAGGVSIKRTRNIEKKNIPLLSKLFKGITSSSPLKVFPNPVSPGSKLTIEYKQLEQGDYSLQLWGQNGQSVYQQEIWIDAEAKLFSINVPSVAAGSYFMVLTNKKTGKKFTEKIIVQ